MLGTTFPTCTVICTKVTFITASSDYKSVRVLLNNVHVLTVLMLDSKEKVKAV